MRRFGLITAEAKNAEKKRENLTAKRTKSPKMAGTLMGKTLKTEMLEC
jgi:hypothetical protein